VVAQRPGPGSRAHDRRTRWPTRRPCRRTTARNPASRETAVALEDSPGDLQTSKGSTTIADNVVTKVAGIAASEIPGVYALGGGAARAVGSLTSRVGLGDERTQGVSVEVGETEAAVDLTVVVEYGESIPNIAKAIRENIIRRIEGTTGLKVTEVNIAIDGLHFVGDDEDDGPSRVQ
jgi:uncharacterized alkaline shock family protein YloU